MASCTSTHLTQTTYNCQKSPKGTLSLKLLSRLHVAWVQWNLSWKPTAMSDHLCSKTTDFWQKASRSYISKMNLPPKITCLERPPFYGQWGWSFKTASTACITLKYKRLMLSYDSPNTTYSWQNLLLVQLHVKYLNLSPKSQSLEGSLYGQCNLDFQDRFCFI